MSTLSHAEKWQVDWYGSARMAGTSGQYMPFWARTGQEGILPVTSSGLLTAGADISYTGKTGIFFDVGADLAGTIAKRSPLNQKNVYGLVDRL